ncbi:MAG: hypothetical protein CFE28_10435 [Alphaproteobacteria bacterium PA2]|nr:MAG: hypothetical protein CFE28_10435 [Alphaproteobacteria bacterium PA2]
MPCALKPFSPAKDLPVSGIEVDVSRSSGGRLDLTYRAFGLTSDLLLPDPEPSRRTDELWRHTCFEVFVQAAGEPGYLEFNFSPSTRWASYRFDDYRNGMADADIFPDLTVAHEGNALILIASLSLPDLAGTDWRLALSAVIESVDGTCSYWAAAHPPGKPDFHHPLSFALTLAGG